MAQFLERKTERRVQLAKEREKYDGKNSGYEQRPQSTPDYAGTITDRIPWGADRANDITVPTIKTNVEATAVAEVSGEDMGEEEAYISATDAEYT